MGGGVLGLGLLNSSIRFMLLCCSLVLVMSRFRVSEVRLLVIGLICGFFFMWMILR